LSTIKTKRFSKTFCWVEPGKGTTLIQGDEEKNGGFKSIITKESAKNNLKS